MAHVVIICLASADPSLFLSLSLTSIHSLLDSLHPNPPNSPLRVRPHNPHVNHPVNPQNSLSTILLRSLLFNRVINHLLSLLSNQPNNRRPNLVVNQRCDQVNNPHNNLLPNQQDSQRCNRAVYRHHNHHVNQLVNQAVIPAMSPAGSPQASHQESPPPNRAGKEILHDSLSLVITPSPLVWFILDVIEVEVLLLSHHQFVYSLTLLSLCTLNKPYDRQPTRQPTSHPSHEPSSQPSLQPTR